MLRRFLPSERSGVVKTFRWWPLVKSNRYANCLRSHDATSLVGFLRDFTAVHRPFTVSQSEPVVCSCGNGDLTVALACDATRTTCGECGEYRHFQPETFSWNEYVEEYGAIDDEQCDDCLHDRFNVAVGSSRHANDHALIAPTWFHIGARCCNCGLLSCLNDYCWPLSTINTFDPNWLCELAREARPDLPWLVDEIGRCISGIWTSTCYIRFVDSSNANQPGAAWQFREVIELFDEKRGALNLNVLKNDRIGGIEFYDRLFINQLQR